MSKTFCEIRSGAYYDSVILMQLQRSLSELEGVLDAGVIMGTDANKDLLAQSDLLAPEAQSAGADDMVIVVRGEDHVTNSGVQVQIFEALGGSAPKFAHFSLFTSAKGDGLSKREGSLSVRSLRDDEGIEPFKTELMKINKRASVYVFSLDVSAREEEFEDIVDLVDLKPIPEIILNVYRRIFR